MMQKVSNQNTRFLLEKNYLFVNSKFHVRLKKRGGGGEEPEAPSGVGCAEEAQGPIRNKTPIWGWGDFPARWRLR
jgi:hypothetical protein